MSGRERNVFFLNLGEGRFAELAGVTGLDFPQDGRAFGVVDVEGDGDLDLILKSRNAPQIRILRNDTPTSNHRIAFQLTGTKSNRDAVGALVELETPQGRRVKQVQVGGGYLSQSTLRLFFGLGSAAGPLNATITWPSGERQTLTGLPVDHLIAAIEGEPEWQATGFESRNFDLSPCKPQEPLNPGVRREGYALLERVPTPSFALQDLAGQTVASSSLRGRPVLLNFWATWCAPCQEEMRQWKEAYENLQTAGVNLVAVSVDEPDQRQQVERFVAERGLPFPVLLMDEETLRRYDTFYRGLFKRSTGMEIPTTFLLDEKGQVVKLYRGIVPLDLLTADLRALKHHPEELVQAALPYPGWRLRTNFGRDHRILAEKFFDHGFLDDAELYFEKAIERRPPDALTLNFLGVINARQGDLEKAKEMFQKYLEMEPGDAKGHGALGVLHARSGAFGLAQESLSRAVELKPDFAVAHKQLAACYIRLRMPGQAATSLERVVELTPADADAYFLLAYAYVQSQRTLEARRALQKVLELQPDHQRARQVLDGLDQASGGGGSGTNPQPH